MISNPIIPHFAWEWMWAPYDELTYAAVLDNISPDDIVLEIGAGDCRLAREIAHISRKVYAIEWNRNLLERSSQELPPNCHVILGDARAVTFPHDVTAAVLLMRHCTNFAGYWKKLQAVKCRKLVTNARWGMSVEMIDLQSARIPFAALSSGWYACSCGNTGFEPGDVENFDNQLLDMVWEVKECPSCTR
ncbi:MAG: rRNA adenine N-6-methyltransferase family protein [Candidatus Promineifilaceae bacterium]|nr:rRNA adenine N-6-methyltransferase family protein [Candidatus Promineifilaceae bacterium]